MAKWGAKTVVFEDDVSDKVDSATKVHHRFDEAMDALVWYLARNQNVGMSRVDSSNDERVYVQKGNSLARTPDIWVLFSDGDDQVHIWDINVVPYAED